MPILLHFVSKLGANVCACRFQPVGSQVFQRCSNVLANLWTIAYRYGTGTDRVHRLHKVGMSSIYQSGSFIGVKLWAEQAYKADQQGAQAAIERAWCKGRDREGLYLLVESRVIVLKLLVVREVAWTRPVEYDAYQPRSVAPHSTGGLDIFGSGFGLTRHDHQAKALDINTDRNHIGCQQYIDAPGQAILLLLFEIKHLLKPVKHVWYIG